MSLQFPSGAARKESFERTEIPLFGGKERNALERNAGDRVALVVATHASAASRRVRRQHRGACVGSVAAHASGAVKNAQLVSTGDWQRELSRLRTVKRVGLLPPPDERTETRIERDCFVLSLVWTLCAHGRSFSRFVDPSRTKRASSRAKSDAISVNADFLSSSYRLTVSGGGERRRKLRFSSPGCRRRQYVYALRATKGRQPSGRDVGQSMWKWILRAWCTALRGTASLNVSRWVFCTLLARNGSVPRRETDISMRHQARVDRQNPASGKKARWIPIFAYPME